MSIDSLPQDLDAAHDMIRRLSEALAARDHEVARLAGIIKKLQRMLVSSVAQAATNAWRFNTLVLLAVVLAAHIACFAVITTQLEARHA